MAVDFVVEQEGLEAVKAISIRANFEETKAALAEMVAPYQNMIVSADAVSAAKTDRAKIRKVSSNIDSYRKSVKQAFEMPLKAFEGKCKELTEICNSAALNLDLQIKDFEQKAKEQKLSDIQAYFASIPKKHPDYADFNRIYDTRWLNTTFRIETAQELMDKFCAAVDSDIDVILSLESEFESYLLTEYRSGKSLSQVMGMANQMKKAQEEKRQCEEERKRLEAERAAKAAQTAQKAPEPFPEAEAFNPTDVVPELRQTVVPEEPVAEAEPTHTVNIWVRGTRAQLAKLSDLLHEAGIEYGAI